MDRPTLFIFSGLPATGKSTLAAHIAQKLGAAYLCIDTIEQGLRDLCGTKVEGEGYRLAYRIAADNLRTGLHVVADCCNPIGLTRDEWESVAAGCGCRFQNIEVLCSDKTEHRTRAERRTARIPGLRLPTWAEIEAREFHQWRKDRITIDTAGKSVEDCTDELMRSIAGNAARHDSPQPDDTP